MTVSEVSAGAPVSAGVFGVAPGVFAAVERAACASTRLAARGLLARLLGLVVPDAAGVAVSSRSSGQPYLVGRPDLSVSLSHDGGWIAAAVGIGVEVGVDVQPPLPVSEGMLRRCCTPSALAALRSLSTVDVEFACMWSVQEACVKAEGTGIGGLPWTVPVEVGQDTGVWHGVRWHRLPTPVPASCAYREASCSPA
ncbi:4'-phosphopantetheinyl transferase family protein [Saccharothrix variisporea]|uniref:4'-phosphopantetheinyl transferase n=1 Tax=Saccharothrix variisporea TaxID=543527 RepID=A0A495XRI8_9PSEU|nr:4'-phosphopantetheinyl transferase superfamily protein [Saccharothrix variisporea]RKT74288.1 4'-phosphopantetheinyl transferase [Saccharothrix variisporea]